MTDFQPMPPLSNEQYAALRDSIIAEGVTVPIVIDQHGRILDGHNRAEIADGLGINYPTVVRRVVDDEDAWRAAVELNCARRHLNQEQKRHLVREELLRHWDDSDRAIARIVGCSPSTVGSIRAIMRSDAEQSVARAQDALTRADLHTWEAAKLVHEKGFPWQIYGDRIERLHLANDPPEFDEEILKCLEIAFGWRYDLVRAATLLCSCTPCGQAREWFVRQDGTVREGIFRHRDEDPEYDQKVLQIADVRLEEFGIEHTSSVQIGQQSEAVNT